MNARVRFLRQAISMTLAVAIAMALAAGRAEAQLKTAAKAGTDVKEKAAAKTTAAAQEKSEVTAKTPAGVPAKTAEAAVVAPRAPAKPGKLAPLEIKLPKALFVNTPKQIKARPTLEPYTEKPRPAFNAPEDVGNIARGKKVTSSDSDPIIGELTFVTDGDKEGADGSFVELGPGKQWVQIDLEKTSDIYAVVVWHYHAEGRVYHGVVVQVSDDPAFAKNVQTIFNNDFDDALKLGAGKHLEYIDDNRGKLIDASTGGVPARGRYVRLYSNGNTSNDMNHYVEVEVYGRTAP